MTLSDTDYRIVLEHFHRIFHWPLRKRRVLMLNAGCNHIQVPHHNCSHRDLLLSLFVLSDMLSFEQSFMLTMVLVLRKVENEPYMLFKRLLLLSLSYREALDHMPA